MMKIEKLAEMFSQNKTKVKYSRPKKDAIFENAAVAIAHIKNHKIYECNICFADLFVYNKKDLIGISFEQLYASHELFVRSRERADQALLQGKHYSDEMQLKRKDGSLFWCALSARPIDQNNPQEGSVWVINDISQRRESEKELHKLQRAVQQSPVSIVITDCLGFIEYVNPRFTRVSGFTLDEVIGQHTRLLKSGETPREVYHELWNTILSGREWHGVLLNKHRDGHLLWEEISISPIVDEMGNTTHFIAVKENINERKRSEDALRDSHEAYISLLSTTLDGFLLSDCQGNLLDVNESYIRQSGYTHQELLSMRIFDLEVSQTLTDVGTLIAYLIENGSDQFESEHRRKDGSIWSTEVSISYRPSYGGQLFIFLRDISTRKLIQKQLEDHQEQLETQVSRRTAELSLALEAAKVADRAKDAFLANMSHELRTPLNAVIGFAGLASMASQDEKQRQTLQKIADAGETLLGIINDLLDLSKIAAGEMHFEEISFCPRQLLTHVHALLSSAAEAKQLELKKICNGKIPEVLMGDPLRIKQILLNLTNNAIKFTEKGKISLGLGGQLTQVNGIEYFQLHITVEDTGIGMSQEELTRVFSPFIQADVSFARKHGGTGLGLAICKRLADGMQGSITVDSLRNKGTRISVILPLKVGDIALLPHVGHSSESPADLTKRDNCLETVDLGLVRFKAARVLLVDDQALNREVAFELLASVGIVPRMANNGREAVDILMQEGPTAFDLVLLDIQMPEMDGVSVTRLIRAQSSFDKLPIVAMTAHTMEHEKSIYLKEGMNDHIGKPFSMQSFFALMVKWLQHRRVANEDARPFTTAASSLKDDNKLSLSKIMGLDPVGALERFSGQVQRYYHWLEIFITESGGFRSQIQNFLTAMQRDDARKCAHAFKGRVGMLGMTALHAQAAELESSLATDRPVADQLDQIEKAIMTLRADLRAVLDEVHVIDSK